MPDASPLWQTIFLGWVFLSLAWSIWCGWRAGVVRAAVSMIGLAVALLFTRQIAAMAPAILGGFGGDASGSIGLAVAVVCGIGIFVTIQIVSGMLFKRTAHHGSWFARFVWGLGGAVLGAIFGAIIVLGVLALVRGSGAYLAPQLVENSEKNSRLSRGVVKLRNSIEAGSTGEMFAKLDPVPDGTYSTIGKFGRVLANPTARARFFEDPEIGKLLQDPRFVAISSDPDVNEAAIDRRVGDLVTNAHVLAAASDPAFVAKLKRIDLDAALDYALEGSDGPVRPPDQP